MILAARLAAGALPVVILLLCLIGGLTPVRAQVVITDSLDRREENRLLDSLYIAEIETVPGQRPKVLHAEPLYIDLIRDLGARRGESEWNFGFGMADRRGYDTYSALVEYEWAPIDRLGLEIELPLAFNSRPYMTTQDSSFRVPENRFVEGLKTAAQWSFYVSERYQTTLALGYLNEVVLNVIPRQRRLPTLPGNVFNPFFVAAHRLGQNYHSLIYTGPVWEVPFQAGRRKLSGSITTPVDPPDPENPPVNGNRNGERRDIHFEYQINTSLHYMLPGTRNFVGLESNQLITEKGELQTILRPQMRLSITDQVLLGVVTGIPVGAAPERLSFFMRLIWEPGHNDKPTLKFR